MSATIIRTRHHTRTKDIYTNIARGKDWSKTPGHTIQISKKFTGMELIPATPTLLGLPVEIRQMIFEYHFADKQYTPQAKFFVEVGGPSLTSENRGIDRCRLSPLLLVSKQIAAEARGIQSWALNISLTPRRDVSSSLDDLAEIDPEIRSKVTDATVSLLCDSVLWHFKIQLTHQQIADLIFAKLTTFPALKNVTLKSHGAIINILPTKPISCDWSLKSLESMLLDEETEKAILDGKLNEDLRKSVAEKVPSLQEYLPSESGNLNIYFELCLSFISLYSRSPKTMLKSKREIGYPHVAAYAYTLWSIPENKFIAASNSAGSAEDNGKLFSWKRL